MIFLKFTNIFTNNINLIISGLGELKKMISDLNIKSIAIPPLGSGNGGLIWAEVKIRFFDNITNCRQTF